MTSQRGPIGFFGFLCIAIAMAGCGGTQHGGEGDDPEVVMIEGALSNEYVAAGEEADVISRIRVTTSALENAARPPINLALVVDTSGSMDGDPIAHARTAALELLDTLHGEDRIAVIAFHSETEVLLPSTRIDGANIEELRAQIGAMRAAGTTDLGGGLRVGLEEVVRNFAPEGVNRLVLLSDGVPNDASPVLPLAQAAGERGIRITALGLGLDYDESLLGQVAQLSGGRFHYVAESSMVAGVFRDEVLRFERVLARNLILSLRPGPGVRVDGVVGQANATGNGGVQISLGDLSEGEHRDIVVRLHTSARNSGAAVELLDAVLQFDDAVANAGRLQRRAYFGARATGDAAQIESGRNEEVERAAAQMMAAMVTVQAIQQARGGNITEARAILAEAERQARMAPQDEAISAQVADMRVLREALPSMAPGYAFEDDSVTGEMAEPEPYRGESTGGSSGSAPAAAPAPPPAAAIRRAHDRAMSVLQSE
ncbi:MAG: VWA domain-containing protein [Sandaracinaceae bacterium]